MASPSKDYPRPDFYRQALHWESLNGPWDFLFDDNDDGQSAAWYQNGLPSHAASGNKKPNAKRTIQVPFVFQSPASGINERAVHQVLWYERRIEDLRNAEEKAQGYRLLLRFGAVDYYAKIWLDGQYVGEHRGGHVPFNVDLTDAIQLSSFSPYRLTIRVFDSAFDLSQPRGKQYWGPKPENIYYTPSSGIWQNVWLESVPAARIGDSSYGTYLRSHNIQRGVLDSRIFMLGRKVGQSYSVEIEASLAGVVVRNSGRREMPRDQDFVRFDLDMRLSNEQLQKLPERFLQSVPLDNQVTWRNGVALWSPERPTLYDLNIRLFRPSGELLDEAKTTVGMRSLNWTTGDGTFKLNGRPYFQALFLDQGYWPDTLMTPPSSDACKMDIELSKSMGFNGCRKHQKVEDPTFMYWADKLGFLVWGEMASAYHFTLEYVERFNQEWMEMVNRDINHPCIVTWTLANESWGYPNLGSSVRERHHLRNLYYMTKGLDPTRPINDNCGWEHVITDLTTFHDYANGPGMAERCRTLGDIIDRGRAMFLGPIYGSTGVEDEGSKHQRGAPVLCTEFGGVNIASANDESRQSNWGYTTANDSRDLLKRVRNIVMATVKDGNCCGIVWTQFTDIEQEQNGLFTYDRKQKLPPKEVKAIIIDAEKAYFAKLQGI